MALPLLNQILIFLIDAGGFLLGFTVFFRDRKARTNQLFGVMILLMLLWVNFAYIPRIIAHENTILALTLLKIAWFVTPSFFVFLYFLAVNLIGWQKKYPTLNIFIGVLGASTAAVTGFTDFVVKDIGFKQGAVRIIYGDAKLLFLGAIMVFVFATLLVVFHAYHELSKNRKQRIQYFLVGLSVFYVMNLTFNVILPMFLDIVRWYWMGDYSTTAVLGFTGYSILKRNLFEIRVVLTTLLIAVIAVVLSIDILAFTENSILKISKVFVLFLFLYLGYLLIRSVQREIKYREELQESYVKLQELSKAKSEFMSIASHQLRTPLSVVKGYTSLLQEGSFGAMTGKQKEVLGKVFKTNEDMISMVNDLLNVTRAEEGRLQYSFEKADLRELITAAAKSLELTAKQKGLSLEYQLPAEPIVVSADKDKLAQVISNLIDNAIKYTEKGGIKVAVSLDEADRIVKVSVQDTGLGIGQVEMKHLFESFSRGKAGTKSWTKGAGMGLYIAKQFMQAHGGRIWAESSGENKGSTFFVELPLVS